MIAGSQYLPLKEINGQQMSLWLCPNMAILFLLVSIQRKKKLLGLHLLEKEPQLLMPFVRSEKLL